MKHRLLSFLCVVCITTAQAQEPMRDFAQTITPQNLQEKLLVIAGTEMEGRATASAGQKKAAAYIETHFKNLGLLPGNGSSYQMVFPVHREKMLATSFTYKQNVLKEGIDYQLSLGQIDTSGQWNINQVAFVRYGLVDAIADDYAGIDVKGKWVMMIDQHPDKTDKPNYKRPFAYMDQKLKKAYQKGAKGVLWITDYLDSAWISPFTGSLYLPGQMEQKTVSLPSVYISVKTAALLMGKRASTVNGIAKSKKGVFAAELELKAEKITEYLESSNVVGVLEGTDKKDEYVVLTAHYDHLGIKDGVIYFGADDDGSGTTAVLAMAEAFTKAANAGYRPKRSIVFMTVSGEELDLWGSEHYTKYPLFPLAKTTIDLNTDMIGRIDPDHEKKDSSYLYVIGDNKLSSDLTPLVDSANAYTHLQLDRKYNDPNDPEQFYYRSDHYNFAVAGVPVIFFFNGTHKDYHKPTDTVDKICFPLMAQRVQLIFYTAWIAANRNDLLKRDIPLEH